MAPAMLGVAGALGMAATGVVLPSPSTLFDIIGGFLQLLAFLWLSALGTSTETERFGGGRITVIQFWCQGSVCAALPVAYAVCHTLFLCRNAIRNMFGPAFIGLRG